MPPEPNKIAQTLYLLICSLFFLWLISFAIPESILELYSLKKIDFLSPILTEQKQDTIPSPIHIQPDKKFTHKVVQVKKAVAPCPKGVVCLEDFSEDTRHMTHFLEALHQRAQGKDNCRIAFYGDSFIEGDILTGDLRDTLQQVFGGKGVGFLPISSEVSLFRKSLPSESDGWKTYSSSKSTSVALGMSGHAYQAQEHATLTLHPTQAFSHVHLLYSNTGPAMVVNSTVNKKEEWKDSLSTTAEGVQILSLATPFDSVKQYKLEVPAQAHATFYGLSIENGLGLYLDNFSLRGNSGLGISAISDDQLRGFQGWMDYKLIVLEFGLNVAAPNTKDFSIYEKNMTKMILHLKELFPQTTFLLLSTSDRSTKQNGSYATMPSIPLLVEAQRRIAQNSGIVFWNMYLAMGGENSMVEFVKHKPALANKDYTHLTFPGGKKIASSLAKALLQEYSRYQHQKKIAYAPVAVK